MGVTLFIGNPQKYPELPRLVLNAHVHACMRASKCMRENEGGGRWVREK